MSRIKILTVIGARPQIIKASAISRAIKKYYADRITEVIVHTGQHYDERMSNVFFEELQIPAPDYNLSVGSATHGVQTAKMIEGLEEILMAERPDFSLIYGDTNSTLAGAIAGAKIDVPIVHIEAGLRSFNKKMPEEINRIVADHVSTLLFAPTTTGTRNLEKEGFNLANVPPFTIDNPGIFEVGDVMFDNTLYFRNLALKNRSIFDQLSLPTSTYILVTLHRNLNTDTPTRLQGIFEALLEVTKDQTLVLPLHPRTAKKMEESLNKDTLEAIRQNPRLRLLPPASFMEMIVLEHHANLIITDSGGVQKEAFFMNKPCIILRAETEWVEIVNSGAAILADADPQRIIAAYEYFKENSQVAFEPLFGQGDAAEKILKTLTELCPSSGKIGS